MESTRQILQRLNEHGVGLCCGCRSFGAPHMVWRERKSVFYSANSRARDSTRWPLRMSCYDGVVDSSHLTPQQIARLQAALGRQLRYLNRLCARMQRLGFPLDDPLCAPTQRARDAMQDLYTTAHYCGCASGVGRASTATTTQRSKIVSARDRL